MSRPRATHCADCGAPLDYSGGRWMNVAPEGQKERIVCRRCWRTEYHKPPPAARPAVAPRPPAPNAPAPEPVDTTQMLVAAVKALAARAARNELFRERQLELARKRGD